MLINLTAFSNFIGHLPVKELQIGERKFRVIFADEMLQRLSVLKKGTFNVIECRDCVWWGKEEPGECAYWTDVVGAETHGNDFCSRAEPKVRAVKDE